MRGLSEWELGERLEECERYSDSVLSKLTEADLATIRTADDRNISIGWALLHVLEHTAYHAGQMDGIRRRWLEQRKDQD